MHDPAVLLTLLKGGRTAHKAKWCYNPYIDTPQEAMNARKERLLLDCTSYPDQVL